MSNGLAKRMSRLEQPAARVCNSSKDSQVLRLLKEIRACCELKGKLEAQKPRSVLSNSSGHEGRRLRDAEISIRILQKICWYTRGFEPLKILQLKILHDRVMSLVQSKVPPDEIGRQMILSTSGGRDLTLVERLFSPYWGEEWRGREKEVPVLIVRSLRESLKNCPGILQHLDRAFGESIGETSVPQPIPIQYHLVGELSGPGCLNSPFCSC
jgi:hypothetical protein